METKNKQLYTILGLMLFCFVMFFAFMGSYPLIDVDETRYVRIAQEMFISNNFLTPVINGEIFLEKPPLFFWFENLSFAIFGVNEWAARLPMAVIASFGVFVTYFTGKKFVSNRFGLISALVLGSNVIYIILSHVAILDLLLSVTMMTSVYLGLMTLYSSGKRNWFEWMGFYIFSGLSALSKGLPGIIIPFGIVFLAYLFSKRLKDLFSCKKIGIGLILLLLVVLPWHIMMYKVHGVEFINEYILKHHLARFVNSAGINRKEPFWFFVPVIFVGFIPFIFTILSTLINEIKKIFDNYELGFNFNLFKYFSPDIPMNKRFLSINILTFIFIFALFSCASTKLPTYILPAAFPLAFITGYIFEENFENNKFEMQIKISNIIMTILFFLIALSGFIAVYIPNRLSFNQAYFVPMCLCIAFVSFWLGIYTLLNIVKNRSAKYFFASVIIFMASVTIILNLSIFNVIVGFGQNELIKYASYAKSNKQKLATFEFGHRYSTIFYYGNYVDINESSDYDWLNKKLEEGYVVILKNKNILKMPSEIKFEVIDSGNKYSLVKKQN